LSNREIGEIVGKAFDKLGVWSRLELAMYVASHGGKGRLTETERHNSLGTPDRSATIRDVA
jgi:hypothetical protein